MTDSAWLPRFGLAPGSAPSTRDRPERPGRHGQSDRSTAQGAPAFSGRPTSAQVQFSVPPTSEGTG